MSCALCADRPACFRSCHCPLLPAAHLSPKMKEGLVSRIAGDAEPHTYPEGKDSPKLRVHWAYTPSDRQSIPFRVFVGPARWLAGFYVPDQGSNLCSLQCTSAVLTTELPGKSQEICLRTCHSITVKRLYFFPSWVSFVQHVNKTKLLWPNVFPPKLFNVFSFKKKTVQLTRLQILWLMLPNCRIVVREIKDEQMELCL